MNSVRRSLLIATAMLTLAVAGCSTQTAAQQGAPAADTAAVDQATVINLGDQPAFFIFKVAQEKGYFDEEFGQDGVTINVESYVKQGPAVVESIASDHVDLALLGTLPTVTANANGNKIIALASANYTEDGFTLFAAPDSGITTVEELAGKRIGLPFGTNEHQVTIELLAKHGLAPTDVQLVNLSGSDALVALQRGDIEAALLKGNDFVAAKKFGATEVANNGETGPVANLLVGREEFVRANPGLTSRVLAVAQKAAEYTEANPDEAIKIASASTGAGLDDTKVNYNSRTRLVSTDPKYLSEPLQDTIDFATQQKLITSEVALSDILDTSLFDASK